MNETNLKKMVSRNVVFVLLTIFLVVILAVAFVVSSLSLKVSELNQKLEKESILAGIWDRNIPDWGTFQAHIPSNINDLFQNKTILWDNENVTEFPESYVNITLPCNFTHYGCLLINISYSTADITYTWVAVNFPQYEGGSQFGGIYQFEYTNFKPYYTHLAVFPVVWTTSVQIQVGNQWSVGNDTQTMSVTYYY